MIELCQIFALTRPGASAPGLRLSFGATRAELKGMADQESPLAAGMLGAADTTRSRLAGATPPALPRPRRHIAATALTAFAAVEPVACAPVGDNIIRPNAWPPAPPPQGGSKGGGGECPPPDAGCADRTWTQHSTRACLVAVQPLLPSLLAALMSSAVVNVDRLLLEDVGPFEIGRCGCGPSLERTLMQVADDVRAMLLGRIGGTDVTRLPIAGQVRPGRPYGARERASAPPPTSPTTQ